MKDEPIVYKGMTASQLADAYNIYKNIPDPDKFLQTSRERAQTVKVRLKPICDIAYGPEPIQKLDIYAPSNAKSLPVLIEIHGGGWAQGSKNTRAIPAEGILSQEIIWVPIDYGLAPAYKMESMISHVQSAIAWVYHNIASFGGGPDCLFIYGNSAGGQLAAMTLMVDWQKDYNLRVNPIKGVICVSGEFDLLTYVYSNAGPQEFLQMSLEEARNASPLHQTPKMNVPVILAYGGAERPSFINGSKEYAAVLEKLGLPVTLIEIPNAHHLDTINSLENTQGRLFKAVLEMIKR